MNTEDFIIENHVLKKYTGNAETVIIPDGVTTISDAFYHCTKLKKVIIPATVTCIQYNAFCWCFNLTEIIMQGSIQKIEKNAFYFTPWLWQTCEETPLMIASHTLIDGQKCTGDIIIPDDTVIAVNHAFNPELVTSVTYRGITFRTEEIRKFSGDDVSYHLTAVLKAIETRDFDFGMKPSVKYLTMLKMFRLNPNDEKICAYLRKKFRKIVQFIIKAQLTDFMQMILDTGMVSKNTIDTFIRCAIAYQSLEIQVMLINYKFSHFRTDSDDEIMRKKFNL